MLFHAVCSNCINYALNNYAPNLPEEAKLYVQNNYFTLASSVLSKNTKDPPDPSAKQHCQYLPADYMDHVLFVPSAISLGPVPEHTPRSGMLL